MNIGSHTPQANRTYARASLGRRAARRALKRVPRAVDVHGAALWMPCEHRLPDYVAAFPTYGRNLIELAIALSHDGHLQFVDVGANIGDSALSIAAAVEDVRALCVEGDPHWIGYLRRNARHRPGIEVEASLLVADASVTEPLVPVRDSGTTRFQPSTRGHSFPQLTVDALRERHPSVADARLIKTDTDGFDVDLVPALARTWSNSKPVIFFEYHPDLTRAVGRGEASRVWDALCDLGYTWATVFDNFGRFRRHAPLPDIADWARSWGQIRDRQCQYWDVAVARDDDPQGRAAISALAPR